MFSISVLHGADTKGKRDSHIFHFRVKYLQCVDLKWFHFLRLISASLDVASCTDGIHNSNKYLVHLEGNVIHQTPQAHWQQTKQIIFPILDDLHAVRQLTNKQISFAVLSSLSILALWAITTCRMEENSFHKSAGLIQILHSPSWTSVCKICWWNL